MANYRTLPPRLPSESTVQNGLKSFESMFLRGLIVLGSREYLRTICIDYYQFEDTARESSIDPWL